MFTRRIFTKNLIPSITARITQCQPHARPYCSSEPPKETKKLEINQSFLEKFKVFQNTDREIVYDIEEERKFIRENTENDIKVPREERQRKRVNFHELAAITGPRTATIEIESLVEILRLENAGNICVIKVPEDLKYVDYLCIVDGRSYRHMIGMAEFVRKSIKMRKAYGTSIPKIEGKDSKDWIAMDLGNVALHIFSEKTRQKYDLESLWCLGIDYEKIYSPNLAQSSLSEEETAVTPATKADVIA